MEGEETLAPPAEETPSPAPVTTPPPVPPPEEETQVESTETVEETPSEEQTETPEEVSEDPEERVTRLNRELAELDPEDTKRLEYLRERERQVRHSERQRAEHEAQVAEQDRSLAVAAETQRLANIQSVLKQKGYDDVSPTDVSDLLKSNDQVLRQRHAIEFGNLQTRAVQGAFSGVIDTSKLTDSDMEPFTDLPAKATAEMAMSAYFQVLARYERADERKRVEARMERDIEKRAEKLAEAKVKERLAERGGTKEAPEGTAPPASLTYEAYVAMSPSQRRELRSTAEGRRKIDSMTATVT